MAGHRRSVATPDDNVKTKTCRRRSRLHQWTYTLKRNRKDYSSVDVLILVALDERRYWVVPLPELFERYPAINMLNVAARGPRTNGPKNDRPRWLAQWEDRWDLLPPQ